MRSLDSLQLSQHPRGIRNGEIPHRSWAGLKSPSKDDRHEDVKQKPVITFPKTPQACAPNIISHKQEFHIGKDIYDTGGWVTSFLKCNWMMALTMRLGATGRCSYAV